MLIMLIGDNRHIPLLGHTPGKSKHHRSSQKLPTAHGCFFRHIKPGGII